MCDIITVVFGGHKNCEGHDDLRFGHVDRRFIFSEGAFLLGIVTKEDRASLPIGQKGQATECKGTYHTNLWRSILAT